MARETREFKEDAVWGKRYAALCTEFNALVDEVSALYAKLNLDDTVTDIDYDDLESAKKVTRG